MYAQLNARHCEYIFPLVLLLMTLIGCLTETNHPLIFILFITLAKHSQRMLKNVVLAMLTIYARVSFARLKVFQLRSMSESKKNNWAHQFVFASAVKLSVAPKDT